MNKSGPRRRKTETTANIKEAVIQTQVVNVLRLVNFFVMEIGKTRRMVRCRTCSSLTPAVGWQGNTPGAPDIIVTHKMWKGDWIGIELKRPGGAIRKTQKELADAGTTSICRSLDEVLEIVIMADANHGGHNLTILNNLLAQCR